MNTPTTAPQPEHADLLVCNPEKTAALLDFPSLVGAIAAAALEFADGKIVSPERQVVPLGADGVMLSMPAVAADLGVHKLVNVQPANREHQLPTIHGMVTVCDGVTGRPLCVLDGP
ncbi:MAG: delta(1)-pyrroline-2-carboxylate reductase family protein, partial [Paucibacter sp.]|nr:delta(1)-pyrroline-2-carboxylate reductase family protein [Roseateles sp.]